MDEIEYKNAIRMIDKIYKELYTYDEVKKRSNNIYNKFENIKKYIDILDKIHTKIKNNPKYIQKLKNYYYQKYIIKRENIPIINDKTKYRKRKTTKNYEIIKSYQDRIIKDQIASIDSWIDFFISDESSNIPMWAKFWAFQGMLKLGTYNKVTMQFNKREKNNTSVFAELNKEALNLSIDFLKKYLNKIEINDKVLEELVKTGSFKRIYEFTLRKTKKETSNIYDGVWIKFNQGTNPLPLVSSIQGFNTEWCIAGAGTAYTQLKQGDFYIYYTKDKNNEYKVPRLAIRMENDNIIREICGVADKQNIEENFEKIIKDKIKNFKDKEEFMYGINQLEYLTYIHQKWIKGEELNKDELIFIYEINSNFIGVVPKKDSRIEEIKKSRNIRKDLAFIFNCKENEIALKEDELYDNPNKIICLYNNLTIYQSKVNFPKLQFIKGNVEADNLKDANGFKSLKRIGGNANFEILTDASSFKNLLNIGESAIFSSLKTSKGFENLISIGNNAYFPELLDTLGFKSLKTIGLNSYYPKYSEAYFPNIEDVTGLNNLEKIKGTAIFYSLKSLNQLNNLTEIRGEAQFISLESISGLEKININNCGGKLYLNNNTQQEWINYLTSKVHK